MLLNLIGYTLFTVFFVAFIAFIKLAILDNVVEIIVTTVNSFVAPVVYDVATSLFVVAYSSTNSYDVVYYMNDVPVFFNTCSNYDSITEVAVTLDDTIVVADTIDVFVPCKGVRKTLGYNDRNDGFCRTLYSRSKLNRSKITKEGKIQRIKPDWKYIDIDDTDIYED